MFRTDEQGNLYILSGNSGMLTLKDLPKKNGKIIIVFDGYNEVRKEFEYTGQDEVIVHVSKEDTKRLGVGEHTWYVDLISNDGQEEDTLIFQKLVVYQKDGVLW